MSSIVPIVGGLALIVGGSTALYVDRLDLLDDAKAPRPIYVRYTSQATFDLRKRPHWIFLSSVIVFATCLLVTAQWQKEYLLQLEAPANLVDTSDEAVRQKFLDRNAGLADEVEFFAIGCAAGGFLVALVPMGTSLGTLLHAVTASLFASFGANYSFKVRDVADQAGKEGLTSTRFAVCMLVLVGCAFIFPSLWPAIVSTGRLQEHSRAVQQQPAVARESQEQQQPQDDDTSKILSRSQLTWARLAESVLACGQICIAITMGICLLTGVVEASLVQDPSTDTWLLFGVVPLVAMVALTGLFWWQNEPLFEHCQARMLLGDPDEMQPELDEA